MGEEVLPEEQAPARRRRIGVAALLAGGIAAVALIAGWIERKPIVAHFVDRKLATAHVAAEYHIAAIGPFAQRLENVRIGDPAAPDLVAKVVELELGYGLDGPYLRAVHAEGVRLNARLAGGKVSLGALDRLLPKTSASEPLALPAVEMGLTDARIALETPAGVIGATIDGHGNLANGFSGHVMAAAGRLDAGGCTITAPVADIAVHIAGRRPIISGPISTDGIACPSRGLRLDRGQAAIGMAFASSLDRWHGEARLEGFGGGTGDARFSGLSGRVTTAGSAQRSEGVATLVANDVASSAGRASWAELAGPYRFAPASSGLVFAGNLRLADAVLAGVYRQSIASATASLTATPVGPLARQAGEGIDHLLAGADADARVALTAGGPAGAGLRIRQMMVTSRQGAGFVRIDEGAGFGWQARDRAWRVDGRLSTGGDGLPAFDVVLRQPMAGGPVDGVGILAPYAAGGARLSMTPIRFDRSHGTTRFTTLATLDGPLGSGRIEGLAVPLVGRIDGRAGMRLDPGCVPVAFRLLAIAGMVLDPARLSLCGTADGAVIARGLDGTMRFGVSGDNLHLAGRSGQSPLTLASAHVAVARTGLTLDGVAVRLGQPERQTRLDVASLTGSFGRDGPSGHFADGAGQIGNVPLLLSDAGGDWTFSRGVLALKGGLSVADADPAPRFHPMISNDVALTLDGGRITASGTLTEPKSGAKVADVQLRHDLATGGGGAVLDVPSLAFAPKHLQPEMLTPLTLGVIANVAGTISGNGRIDWTAKGVTSSGDFRTDGIDLAAAFGPVTKIAGTIHFSDLLGLVTPPHQEATIAEVNPGVAVSNGVVHYRLPGAQQVEVEDARWPFAGGDLVLEPSVLSFEQAAQRHLTFRVTGLDAAAFVQQLAFPNISATGIFDGVLPMIFDQTGGRIEGGVLTARRGGGSLAYVGELTSAQLGTMGKLAFDALKKIRYNALAIGLDGRLDGEIISHVSFDGVRQDTGEGGLVARMIRNLPFRFNIRIEAPFRGLLGSARAFADPSVLLQNGQAVPAAAQAAQPSAIQHSDSETVR